MENRHPNCQIDSNAEEFYIASPGHDLMNSGTNMFSDIPEQYS